MRRTQVKLSQAQLRRLNRDFPASRLSSANVGKRAIEIVRVHYVQGRKAREVQKPKGADLAFKLPHRADPVVLEVKGTADSELAFPKLKVSGKPSRNLLAKGKAKLLRVVKVFEAQPEIVELAIGKDFELVPEPRWRVKPPSSKKALQGTRRQATRP